VAGGSAGESVALHAEFGAAPGPHVTIDRLADLESALAAH